MGILNTCYQRFLKKSNGISTAECMLGGILVAVACIGAVKLLAGNFLDLSQFINQHTARQVASAEQFKLMQNVADQKSAQATQGKSTTQSDAALASVLSQTNMDVDLSSYPVDLSQSIETAGANGTTMLLLSTLEIYVKSQLEQGVIDQTQANSILKLATQGYKMADIMSAIEQAAAKSGNNRVAFRETQVPYNGSKITVGELTKVIGADNPLGGSHNVNNPVVAPDGTKFTAGDEMANFFNTLSDVNHDQTIPTNVKDVVNVLSGQIAEVTRTVASSGFKTAWVSSSPSSFSKTVNSTLFEENLMPKIVSSLLELPSQIVGKKSSDICSIGNGKKVGLGCQASASAPGKSNKGSGKEED